MKQILYSFLMLTLFFSLTLSQLREYRTHTRSMLRQTVYNTGEIGRALEASRSTQVGLPAGTSSWEWPPNSYQILDQIVYWGYQNSFGNGILFSATINGASVYKACGGIGDGSGNSTTIAGIHCTPGTITRTENYPVLADGSLNTSYDPNEAEEKIVTSYTTTNPMKLLVTQTSRAWSFPGYDAFIIIEYDILNIDTVNYTDGFVMFENALVPSAFGIQRKYGTWDESGNTTRSKEVYARYNLTRYMTYVHSRNGFPESAYFNQWSLDGNRGALNSPQAPGFMMLYYDTLHLQLKNQTAYTISDNARVWDVNNRFIQPYTAQQIPNRNIDLSSSRAVSYGLTLSARPFQAFDFQGTSTSPKADSVNFANYYYPYKSIDAAANNALMNYWTGRAKTRALGSGNYTQTSMHYTSFGPYVFKKGEHIKFAVAECVGYGPGETQDTVLRDPGGAASEPTGYVTGWYKPVVSMHDSITYPGISSIASNYMGSGYLKSYPLPWYVTGKISKTDTVPVISLRSVADRAIQMYTGKPYTTYNTIQYKPELSPVTGAYTTSYIPFPSPVITVNDATDFKNKVVWGPQVEGFKNLSNVLGAVASGRIKAGLAYYIVLKSPRPGILKGDALGPWGRLDSVGLRDTRYYNVDPKFPNQYVLRDTLALLGENYYYAVISVDSLGGRSGMTNITLHSTQKGAVEHLGGKIYVAPNPFIVSSPFGGSTTQGDINDKIEFFGLPRRAKISVFSYSGQLVGTIDHNANVYSHEYFQISRNNQLMASGVYFYVVEDLEEGTRTTGKFVIIH